MSAYEVTPEWKSPRKLLEEERDYLRQRFEEYWQQSDLGLITRLEMLNSLKDECE